MKHFCIFLLLLLPAGLSAQQTIDIAEQNSPVYTGTTCPTPVNATVYVFALTTGLTPGTDVVDVFVDFGDGNTTLVQQQVINYNSTQQYVSYNAPHAYANPGVYTITSIVTTPDGTDDTLILVNAVSASNTCNNLTGRVYRDNNSNCIYDGGDTDIPWQSLKMKPVGDGQYAGFATNASGQYQSSTFTGAAYELILNYYTIEAPLPCGQDTVIFTSTGSDVIDFALAPVTIVELQTLSDSLGARCYGNGDIYLSGQVGHYGDGTAGSLEVYVAFGDGNDSTITVPLAGSFFKYGYFGIQHQYAAPGIYSVMAIATDLAAGVSDTLYAWNEVELLDSCGAITGTVYDDLNTSCNLDGGDNLLDNAYVTLFQNSVYMNTYLTDAAGNYSFDVPPGNYTVELGNYVNYSGWSMACSSTFSRNVVLLPAGTVTENFGLVCSATTGDASVDMYGWGFRPALPAYLYPAIYASSCIATSGTATLVLDPLTTFAGTCDTTLQVTVSGNTISWPYASAAAVNWYSYIQCIMLTVDSTAQIGDSLCFTFYITPSPADSLSSNDTIYACFPVRNSWDPNMKEVFPAGPGANGHVAPNTEMTYTVHFQNTGNDVAFNIAITDTIDPNLDMSTLQILGSSHPMTPDVTGSNILRFNFYNINLPDSTSNEPMSHGWVTYRIDPYQWLPDGTQIDNTAYIYFDFNEAIITNTTNTIVDWALSINEVEMQNGFAVAPVPADDYVNVSFDREFKGTVTLRDISGREVKQVKMNGTRESIYVGDLAGGVYTITVSSETGMLTQKIIVQH